MIDDDDLEKWEDCDEVDEVDEDEDGIVLGESNPCCCKLTGLGSMLSSNCCTADLDGADWDLDKRVSEGILTDRVDETTLEAACGVLARSINTERTCDCD